MALDIPVVIFLISILILFGILVDRIWLRAREHFSAYERCSRAIDHEGNEREFWSFHSFRANTFTGNTLGRLCIAFASWRFYRRHPDLAPLVLKGQTDK